MKSSYETPEVDIIELEDRDVIVASGGLLMALVTVARTITNSRSASQGPARLARRGLAMIHSLMNLARAGGLRPPFICLRISTD